MNTLKKILTTLFFSTLCIAFNSNATLISSWDWEVDTTFTEWAPGGVVGTLANDTLGGATFLEWGEPPEDEDPISSLQVTSGDKGNNTGTVLTGGIDEISVLAHSNNPIFDPTLDTATLRTRLTVNGDGNGEKTLADLDFGIKFLETLNDNPCGFNTKTDTPCDDIFIITPPDGVTGFFDEDLMAFIFNQSFEYEGRNYIAQLIVEGLGVLLPDFDTPLQSACAEAGVPELCLGFLTEEGEVSEFTASLRILVPEPSSILLMSLALFGIFASMRNKHI